MGSGAQEEAPLAAGLPNAKEVRVLEIADTTVDHLEGVRRGGTTEVTSLEEGHAQASQRRIPGNADSEDTSPDHDEVVLALRESLQVPSHRETCPSSPSGSRKRIP
jgi:hypothetical protein